MTPNEQRTLFLTEVAKGRRLEEALLVAGYDLHSAQAHMARAYLESPEGQAELRELRENHDYDEADDADAGKKRTSDDVIRDLREVYKKAMRDNDLKAALRALELEGKHRGTFADKIEISGKIDIAGTILAARKRVSLKNRLGEVEDAVTVEPEPAQVTYEWE